jgi:hypothetical protein
MRRMFAITVVLTMSIVGTGLSGGNAGAEPRGAFTPPTVQKGYYDGHLDAFVSTDTSSKAQAKAMDINYAPGLGALDPDGFPEIYRVKGARASGQLVVLGSEPGESSYSPIWHEVTVRWKKGSTPILLTSDTQIDRQIKAGNLTENERPVLSNEPVIAEKVGLGETVDPPTVFATWYDAHKDGMLATDVSKKSQAKAQGINYVPTLGALDPEGFPEIYIVRGSHADGQLMVLGSEPGEPDYSPLWRETIVRWKSGTTPTLIKSDTRIDVLIAAGKVTERGTRVILNCPVTGER